MKDAAFDPNRILEDSDVLAEPGAPILDVQSFLVKHGSPLASMKIGPESVSSVLTRFCEAASPKINPRVVLLRLQVEQSLIQGGLAHPSKHALAWACGFGATDGGRITNDAGLLKQLYLCVGFHAHHWTGVAAKIGKPFKTLDQRIVHPANRATVLCLTYTPWIGDRDFNGMPAPFGAKLTHICKNVFFPDG